MFFKTTPEITPENLKRGMWLVTADGVMSQILGTLTTGTFLIAYAVSLGASNFMIGLLSAIPALAGLIQIVGIYLVERVRNRRSIVVWSALISRLLFIPLILAPFFLPHDMGLFILFAVTFVSATFGSLAGCAWNSWMRDLIPVNMLGDFFSRRLAITTVFGMLMSYAGATIVDVLHEEFPHNQAAPYGVLFAMAMIAGLVGVIFLARTPETTMPEREGKIRIFSLLIEPFKDVNFRSMLIFLGSWNFAVSLALPFFTVYMLTRLHFNLTFIISLSLITQLLNILFFQIWGKFADRFSNKAVFNICGPLFIFAILGWTFTTLPNTYFLTTPLVIILHIVMGIAAAGVAVASGNMSLKLAPKGKGTSYLAANSLINSLAAGIGPLIGGKFADFFAARQLSWVLTYTTPNGKFTLPTLDLEGWDFFFVLSFLAGIYSLHRLSVVREEGMEPDSHGARAFLVEFKNHIRDTPPLSFGLTLLGVPFGAIQGFGKKIVYRVESYKRHTTGEHTSTEPVPSPFGAHDDVGEKIS